MARSYGVRIHGGTPRPPSRSALAIPAYQLGLLDPYFVVLRPIPAPTAFSHILNNSTWVAQTHPARLRLAGAALALRPPFANSNKRKFMRIPYRGSGAVPNGPFRALLPGMGRVAGNRNGR